MQYNKIKVNTIKMKKNSKWTVFCIAFTASFFAASVFAQRTLRVSRSSPSTAVPSDPTILSLASRIKRLGALGATDAVTKGRSDMKFASEAFTHGAQIISGNASMVQGASVSQAGAHAGSTTVNSDLLTGYNLVTVGKMATGHEGNAIKGLNRSALLTANTSTQGSASTAITGQTGVLGNSTLTQTNTVLGSTVSQGPVTGSTGTMLLSGNPYHLNS